MFKTTRNYLLLMLILAFSFIYRIILMVREIFPPGADIGLHNSIIHSITQSGNTDFLYNFYHMGGGSSVTFPGYHIFVSYVILYTGLNDYLAQALVVSVFSSLIVLVAFLITRRVWNTAAALMVAFLVAVSRFDIEMIMWSGYPNVITLLLIPVVFYLFLQKERISIAPFLLMSSLLSAAIFITHSLSSVLFIGITAATVLFIALFAGKMCELRTGVLIWLLPLFIGGIIISPFLLEVAPVYLSADAATFTGGVAAIRDALLSTKVLPLEIVLPLFACVSIYFMFSKYYLGKFLNKEVLLLVMWWLVPAILTQGYLFGLYTDYQRFLYFVILPIIILIGFGLYHCARFVARALSALMTFVQGLPQVRLSKNPKIRKILPYLKHNNFLFLFLVIFMLYAFLAVPLFAPPSEGISVQSFYQLMNSPEYEAIQWAKNNTPANALFLTDAQYGWWFSGFALRPTISAVEPQYLTNYREFEPATIANRLLDTDYLVDNGLIQVREDGGYTARHNPEFLAKFNDSYFPYAFFNFNNNEITVTLRDQNGKVQTPDLSQMLVIDQHMENDSKYASIYLTRGNDLLNFTEKTTVYQGKLFSRVDFTVTANTQGISFDTVRFLLHTKGFYVPGENDTDTTLAFVDVYYKVVGQIIFTQGQPETKVFTVENPSALEMTYNLDGNASAELNFYAGVYEYNANPDPKLTKQQQIGFYQNLMTNHTESYQDVISDLPLDVFDYHQAIEAQGVSYIAVRDSEQFPRFGKDPFFSLVFINDKVAIFQVHNAT